MNDTILLNQPPAYFEEQISLALKSLREGELLALGEALRHRLAVHLGELRLGIEGFQLRWAARHGQPDHPGGFLGKVGCLEHPFHARRPGQGGR